MQEIEQLSDFKTHNLPLARIKKIMKSDEDVRMISSEAPALFARACEIFILEVRSKGTVRVSPGVLPPPAARTARRDDTWALPQSNRPLSSLSLSSPQLTLRAWAHSEENKRRTLQRSDVAGAIAKTDIFDFLVDIVPREEFKDEAGARVGAAPAAVMPVRRLHGRAERRLGEEIRPVELLRRTKRHHCCSPNPVADSWRGIQAED